MSDNVQRIRAGYAAFESRDIPAILDLLDPHLAIHVPDSLPGGGRLRGIEGMQSWITNLAQLFDPLIVAPEEYLDAGDHVIVRGRLTGTARATSQSFETRFIHVWKLSPDGKAIDYHAATDSAQMVQALDETTGITSTVV